MKKIMFVVAFLVALASPVYSAGKECYVAGTWENASKLGSQFWLEGDCVCVIGEADGTREKEDKVWSTEQAIKTANDRLTVIYGKTKFQKIKVIGIYENRKRDYVYALLYACPVP